MRTVVKIVVLVLICFSSATAETKQTYGGVIVTSRARLEDVSRLHHFPFLKKEMLSSGTIHFLDVRVNDSTPQNHDRRKSLCRRAKIRRIQAAIPNRSRCSPNLALHSVEDPNDPLFTLQNSMKQISAPAAWDVEKGNESLVAVVIDSGIHNSHIDLRANMWVNPKETPNNGIDDDKNGFVDDINGANMITNVGSGVDDNGHGTHVAGIIGATGNNYTGISGVSQKVRLVSAKFLSSTGSGSTANAIKAINYATSLKQAGHKVVVTNNSYGSTYYSKPLYDAIKSASDNGILFVAAAGNNRYNNDSTPFYPASYELPNVISVASVDLSGSLSSFSNYGAASVDIAAPGSSVYSTLRTGSYGYMSGTSMAAPHVTGLAVLIQSACVSHTTSDIRKAILQNGNSTPKLYGVVATGSILSAVGSVTAAKAACQPSGTPVATPTPSDSPTITPTSTPTPTPTTTPSATPTPIVAVSLSPSVVYANQSATLSINYQGTSTVQAKLETATGAVLSCAPVSLNLLASKSITLNLPVQLRYFKRLQFEVFTDKTNVVSSSVESTGKTVLTQYYANLVCKSITSQIK
jgi:subtilisin family serine protease